MNNSSDNDTAPTSIPSLLRFSSLPHLHEFTKRKAARLVFCFDPFVKPKSKQSKWKDLLLAQAIVTALVV